eukprot:GHVN01097395.1.p1 GENE.GHVN01097395.1~~GHVN01097395.1.p1  ORF type:complete len:603 (-),score=103.83 GHVN01097395.1:1242-3050(-)
MVAAHTVLFALSLHFSLVSAQTSLPPAATSVADDPSQSTTPRSRFRSTSGSHSPVGAQLPVIIAWAPALTCGSPTPPSSTSSLSPLFRGVNWRSANKGDQVDELELMYQKAKSQRRASSGGWLPADADKDDEKWLHRDIGVAQLSIMINQSVGASGGGAEGRRLEGVGEMVTTELLPRLEMDVIVVPKGITSDQIVDMVRESVSCVSSVTRDVIRLVEGHGGLRRKMQQNETEESIPIRQPSNSTHTRDSTESPGEGGDHQGIDHPRESENIYCTDCWMPADPNFDEQWALMYHFLASIDAQRGWTLFFGSNGPSKPGEVIGVLDTGVSRHSDLDDRIYLNPEEICDDGIDNDNNGYVDDCHGWDFGDDDNNPFNEPLALVHGTPVAGCVAAEFNDQHLAGVCPTCRIMPLKIYRTTLGGLSVAAGIRAIDYMIMMGVRLSVNSYGGFGKIGPEYQAIKALGDNGHLFVAAAGNDGCDLDKPTCTVDGQVRDLASDPYSPGGYDLENILTVAANNINFEAAWFSNYGVKSVDLFAPGQSIHVLFNQEMSDTSYMDGTSFACPIAAGVAGVLWSLQPDLTMDEVKQLMMSTVNNEMNNLEGVL